MSNETEELAKSGVTVSILGRAVRKARSADFFWMLVSYVLGFGLQGIYFLIVARALGAAEYGVFAGALALATIVSTLAGLGAGSVLVMKTSRDKSQFGAQLGTALVYIILTACPLSFAAYAVGGGATTSLAKCLLPLLISELIFTRILDVGYQSFQARDLLRWTAVANGGAGAVRAVIAGSFSLLGGETATEWAWVYSASSILLGVSVLFVVILRLGGPRIVLASLVSTWRIGIFFAIGMSARVVYVDVDKYMLNRFGFEYAAGNYAAGARLMNFAFAPVQALVYSKNTAMFKSGAIGYSATWILVRRMLVPVVLYGIVSGLFVFSISPLIVSILGESFQVTADVLRLLFPLVLLQGLHYLFGDALMGLGQQSTRSAIQLGVAFLSVLLNFWLIPIYGWRGAICATLICSTLLAASVIIAFVCGARLESAHNIRSATTN